MTATTIYKGAIAAASALALAGAVLAQVQTGAPTSGTGAGVTPPPSTGVTTDTSRLATDCDQVAANAQANQPPHVTMGCNRAGAAATMGAVGTTATVGPTASSTTTANAAPESSGPGAAAMPSRPTRVARADRG